MGYWRRYDFDGSVAARLHARVFFRRTIQPLIFVRRSGSRSRRVAFPRRFAIRTRSSAVMVRVSSELLVAPGHY